MSDCLRFPNRDLVSELLAFNRAYRQHMDARQALELASGGSCHEAVQEADRLYQVWDTVRDARCDYYYVTVRRQALKKLRDRRSARRPTTPAACPRTSPCGASPASISGV